MFVYVLVTGIEFAFPNTGVVIGDERCPRNIGYRLQKSRIPISPISPASGFKQDRHPFSFDDVEMEPVAADIDQCIDSLASACTRHQSKKSECCKEIFLHD